jgi:hypothetical protein
MKGSSSSSQTVTCSSDEQLTKVAKLFEYDGGFPKPGLAAEAVIDTPARGIGIS